MSEQSSEAVSIPCESPPPAPRPAEPPTDPRVDLLRLADALTRDRSHRALVDYLRARRSSR